MTAPPTRIVHRPLLWLLALGLAAAALPWVVRRSTPAPLPALGDVPAFELLDTRGRGFGSADLAGRPWIASFFFTRCTSVCPRLTAAMRALDARYRAAAIDGVHLVGVTVDPDHDTTTVLARYGEEHGIDPLRWTLLTGPAADVERLVVGGFRLAMGEPGPGPAGLLDIAHSGKLALVDGAGRIRGYHDTDDAGLDELFRQSRRLLVE